MNTHTILYLSRNDIEAVGLSMPEIIEALDAMFKEKGEGRVEIPPKPGIHTRKDAFIHETIQQAHQWRAKQKEDVYNARPAL